jgi:septal ring factor EnvC (AmiA/AmiB activator)
MRGNAQQGGSADFGELLKHMRRMHARLETMEKGQKEMAETMQKGQKEMAAKQEEIMTKQAEMRTKQAEMEKRQKSQQLNLE